jgi:hypothetical protein
MKLLPLEKSESAIKRLPYSEAPSIVKVTELLDVTDFPFLSDREPRKTESQRFPNVHRYAERLLLHN